MNSHPVRGMCLSSTPTMSSRPITAGSEPGSCRCAVSNGSSRPGRSRPGTRSCRTPVEVTTDWAPVYPRVIDELAPGARHVLEQYANNVIEADHGRLRARFLPMRGFKRIQSAGTVATGHAFVQNSGGSHHRLGAGLPARDR